MEWQRILLTGIVSGIIITVALKLSKKGLAGKIAGAAVILSAVVLWNILDIPRYISNQKTGLAGFYETRFDTVMNDIPAMQLLKDNEPALWKNLRAQFARLHNEGKSQQQIIDAMQPQITAVQLAALQHAPDEDVVAYIRVNLEQIAAAQTISGDTCFRFLFPAVKGGIDPVDIMPGLLQKRMDSDAAMLRHAYGSRKHRVTAEERRQAAEDIRQITPWLAETYGEDIQILSDPRLGVGKEDMACNMTQDLWRRVLALPAKNAAGIIRLTFAGQSPDI